MNNRLARLWPQNFRLPGWLWQARLAPAFWSVASLISLTVNVILIVALILLGRELFSLKALVSEQLLGGLANNFALMDQASITTNVVVEDTIPVQFILPVDKQTVVTLTQDTELANARVDLSTGGLVISNAPTDIRLPAGTELAIQLSMEIPVDATVPVSLNVPVNIPLNQTELHEPFTGLQQVVQPYDSLLKSLPNSWAEILCPVGDEWGCWLLPWP